MNQNVKLDIEKQKVAEIRALTHDGRGIATINNKTLFVSGALPSETVTYQITQKHSQYDEAKMVSLLTPSSERVAPPCPHFGYCGGCSLQHMRTDLQLQHKQQLLLDQLKHFGQVAPLTVLPPLNSNTLGYRRKARLGVKFVIKKNKVLVGFREKASRYLADIDQCVVLHPRIGEHLDELKNLIASLAAYRTIPQIEVAIGDQDVALVFRHMEPLTEKDQDLLIAFGEQHDMHIYAQPNPPLPVYALGPERARQRITYSLPSQQLTFLFHPLDFTQVNLDMNRLMVNQALQLLALQPDDTVLDLFCGIGNFSLAAARLAKKVTGVEGSLEMVARANDNAQHNGITNVTFHAANLMADEVHAPWLQGRYNKILLDPPRAGAKEMLAHCNRLHAERILYVSCNPATLARDAGELVHQHGYVLKQAGIMNMFPHTAHIEAMAVFEKNQGGNKKRGTESSSSD